MVGKSRAQVAPATGPIGETGAVPRVEVFRALGDPTRLAVLDILATRGPRCHCDLEEDLEVKANRLSFHLKVLRDVGLVDASRHGRRSRYHLTPGAIEMLREALPSLDHPDQSTATCTACHTTDLEASR